MSHMTVAALNQIVESALVRINEQAEEIASLREGRSKMNERLIEAEKRIDLLLSKQQQDAVNPPWEEPKQQAAPAKVEGKKRSYSVRDIARGAAKLFKTATSVRNGQVYVGKTALTHELQSQVIDSLNASS